MLSHSTMNDCKPSMPRESTNGGPMIVDHGESNGHDAMTNGEKSVVNGFQGNNFSLFLKTSMSR